MFLLNIYIIYINIYKFTDRYINKTLFGSNVQFLSAWGIMIKTWGRVFLGSMSKDEQIQFFDSQMYLHTINLKLFRNHGGIYRFRRKFKKDCGEKSP